MSKSLEQRIKDIESFLNRSYSIDSYIQTLDSWVSRREFESKLEASTERVVRVTPSHRPKKTRKPK